MKNTKIEENKKQKSKLGAFFSLLIFTSIIFAAFAFNNQGNENKGSGTFVAKKFRYVTATGEYGKIKDFSYYEPGSIEKTPNSVEDYVIRIDVKQFSYYGRYNQEGRDLSQIKKMFSDKKPHKIYAIKYGLLVRDKDGSYQDDIYLCPVEVFDNRCMLVESKIHSFHSHALFRSDN